LYNNYTISVDGMDRDQTIIDQYFGPTQIYTPSAPSMKRKLSQSSEDVSDIEHSDTDEDYLCSIDYLHDEEWGKLKYPTDTDGKGSWKPKPLATELLENRQGLLLDHAIYKKDIKTINELLQHAVNLEICDENGNNALMLSIAYQCKDLIRFLMRRGVELEDTNDEGANALHIACLMGDERLVHTLLSNWCNPNTPVRNTGDTPLHIACDQGSMHIVKMLVHRNVDLTARNKMKQTPLDVLKSKEELDEELIKYLEDKVEQQRKKLLEYQNKFTHAPRIHNYPQSQPQRWFYNPATNSLEPYFVPPRQNPTIQREPSKSVIFGDEYGQLHTQNSDSEKWYNSDSDPDLHDKYGLYDSDSHSDPDLRNLFGDDDHRDEWSDGDDDEYFWGPPPLRKGYTSPPRHEIVDLSETQNPLITPDDIGSLSTAPRVSVPSRIAPVQLPESSRELYFCKKCYQEGLDISTGVCQNCQHIYGMYSGCPWCESGTIDGYGNCDSCEFVLYKKPKHENSQPEPQEHRIYQPFEELVLSSSDEEDLECICCGHIHSQGTRNEYCEMCGYLLSNLCNNCGTTLRFEGDEEDLQEACWQCGQQLCETNL
jgi:ankyrin repeat protein